MNDKRATPEESTGKGRRKRTAPTIDLTATEVPQADQAPQADQVQPVTSEADPPPPPEPRRETPIEEPPAPEPTPQIPPQPEPPSREPTPVEEPPAADPPVTDPPAEEPPKRSGFALNASALAAGFIGAAAMSVVLLGLWLSGLMPIRFAGSTATRARVTALEMQIQEMRDLQKKNPQQQSVPSANAPAVDALTRRVASMEDTLKNRPAPAPAATDPALSQRIDATDKAIADLRASLQNVSKTADAGASSSDIAASLATNLAPLQQRIDALEQQAKTAKDEIAKASASDRSSRLALVAAALRDAALRGAPFAAELAQAKSLGADDKLLAPLAPFALAGVPNDKTLAQELSTILPGMRKSVTPAPSGDFFARLQANASQLVRIQPVDAPAGDDPSTVLARLDVDAAHADIAAALTDLGKLTDAQRAPAQAWIDKAKSRQAALAAARQFAADTARSLGTR